MKTFSFFLGALLYSLILAGCGGGGGGAAGTPVAATPTADTFTWTGNTHLTVAAAQGVLVNDPAGSAVADPGARITALGGTADLAAGGGFTYDPPVGVQNAMDTFTYTVAGFAPVTVSVNLTERIWFVRNDNPGGTGTFLDPFPTLVEAETVSDASDTIFVFAGDFADTGQDQGITLKAGQRLLGVGVGLRVNNVPLVNPAPPNARISNAGLAVPGDTPVVRLTTDATAGNEVAGLTIEAAFNEAILATTGAGHNVHDNTITLDPVNGREGIRLLAVTGANSLVANSITGSPRDGIKLANNENEAGNPAAAIPVIATVTMSRNSIRDSAQDGIAVNLDGATTNVTLNIMTNRITNSGQQGLDLNSLGAATVMATVSRNEVSGSTAEGILLAADGNSSLDSFTANSDLAANGGVTDFRAATTAAGAASICLELENNSNVAPDSNLAGDSTFQVENNGGASFDFFEALNNDTPAIRVGAITDVPLGTCGIPLDGAELFEANCAICHTGNGLGFGNVGPDITNRTAARINFQLTNNPTMSDIRLTGREIDTIAGALASIP